MLNFMEDIDLESILLNKGAMHNASMLLYICCIFAWKKKLHWQWKHSQSVPVVDSCLSSPQSNK